jgi:hypothetical protein
MKAPVSFVQPGCHQQGQGWLGSDVVTLVRHEIVLLLQADEGKKEEDSSGYGLRTERESKSLSQNQSQSQSHRPNNVIRKASVLRGHDLSN